MSSSAQPLDFQTVRVDFEDGVAWVTLNHPEKRNFMNPTLNAEMHEALDTLEADDRCAVLVLTGAGETFDGLNAAEMNVVNEALSLEQLRERVRQMAGSLLEKNPQTLKAAKGAVKRVAEMTVDESEDYLVRQESPNHLDKSEGLKQFVDDMTYRPALGAYRG